VCVSIAQVRRKVVTDGRLADSRMMPHDVTDVGDQKVDGASLMLLHIVPNEWDEETAGIR
jgi:hypothetical protein